MLSGPELRPLGLPWGGSCASGLRVRGAAERLEGEIDQELKTVSNEP